MDDLLTLRDETRDEEGFSLSFFLLCLLLFLMFFRPEDLIPSTQALHIPMIVSVLCLLSHMFGGVGQGRRIFALSPITKMLGVISFWALATIPFGYWITGATQVFYDYWLKKLLFFLLLGNIVQSARQLRRTVWLCLLSVLGVSLIAVAIRILYGPQSASGRLEALAGGPYSGSNYLSITVLLVLPFALFLFFLDKGILVRLAAGGAAVVFAVATLLTESRAGAVALAVIVAVTVWKLRRWGKNPALVAAVVVLTSLLIAPFFAKGLVARFSTVIADYDLQQLTVGDPLRMALGSYQERVQILTRALTVTLKNPITGVGMGNFSSASAKEFFTGTGRDWLGSHNTYLQFSSELGIPGLLMYLFLLRLTFKTLRQAKQRILPLMAERPDLRSLALMCDATTVALYGYLITSGFANVAYNIYFFVLAGIAQAISLIAHRVPETTKAQEAPPEDSAWWPGLARPDGRVVQ